MSRPAWWACTECGTVPDVIIHGDPAEGWVVYRAAGRPPKYWCPDHRPDGVSTLPPPSARTHA